MIAVWHRGTTGRDIVKCGKRLGGYVYLNGEKVTINAKAYTLTGYSAQADQKGLLDWVKSMSIKPGKIKLVHGEPSSQLELSRKLENEGFNVV